MREEIRYTTATKVDQFLQEVMFRMSRAENLTLVKAEIDQLKDQILFKDCDNKDVQLNKQLYALLEKVMIYCGFWDKNLKILSAKTNDASRTQI